MFRFIGRYFKNVWRSFTNDLNGIMDGSERNDPALKEASINRLIGLLLTRLFLWGIPGIYFSIRGVLGEYLKCIMFIYGVGAVLAWGTEDEPQPSKPEQPQPLDGIAEVRARAEKTYPLMKQTAYLLFTDLCRYLSGLVAPFSLSAVTAPVNFDITPSLVTQFHFVVAKGQCDAPTAMVKEILDNLVFQHLKAQDLPISIPAIYTAADGSTWPGLVVDGVYDLGSQYRVDLVITNEAEATALKAKGLFGTDEDTAAAPHDPDFD